MLYLGRNEMKPTDASKQPALAPDANWLKGSVPLRAYMAQRDQFLELHKRNPAGRQEVSLERPAAQVAAAYREPADTGSSPLGPTMG